MVHISTGDLFRYHLEKKTPLGKRVDSFVKKGELVPDDLTSEVLRAKLEEVPQDSSFILDGFPRNIPQAEVLEALLTEKNTPIQKAFFLGAPEEVLVQRITGRRLCKGCGKIYHESFSPPKKKGFCDLCKTPLYQRDDDREETVRKRLGIYKDEEEKLKNFYKKKNLFQEIDATGDSSQVFHLICAKMA